MPRIRASTDRPPAAAGWTLASLRPAGEHAALRRAAASAGARLLALSPLRLSALDPGPALAAALACPCVVFTSPAAVRFARRLQPLRNHGPGLALAVGAGTRAALERAGAARVDSPVRMDSEGLLALPALAGVRGLRIGLVTAPGGRDLIARSLAAAGARIVRAEVYRRAPRAIAPRAVRALLAAPPERLALALSSAEALHAALAQLPDPARAHLLRAQAIAASPRLHRVALETGFRRVATAASARPPALVSALSTLAQAAFR